MESLPKPRRELDANRGTTLLIALLSILNNSTETTPRGTLDQVSPDSALGSGAWTNSFRISDPSKLPKIS